MKKIILAAVAASIMALPIAAPAAAAPNGHDNRGRVEQVRTNKQVRVVNNNRRQVVKKQVIRTKQVQAHRWSKGQRFDGRKAHTYRVISNPRAYRLNDAPRGYRWVQSDNDAVLVAITSSVIGAVLANRF